MDLTTAQAITHNFTIGGTFASDKDLLKALQKANDTDALKLVAITAKCEIEQLYGMPEDMFIRLAEKLPPRGANEVDGNEEWICRNRNHVSIGGKSRVSRGHPADGALTMLAPINGKLVGAIDG